MKSESWIIIELLVALLFFGYLSFFWTPIYEKGAWAILTAIISLISMVFGYKFGKGMPQQASDPKEGQASKSEITSKITTEAPQEPPPPVVVVETPKLS